MAPPQKTIPIPRNIKNLEKRTAKMQELWDAMGWGAERFKKFRTVEEYPDLQNYHKYWPIAMYYNYWISGRVVRESEKNSIRAADSDSEEDVPLTSSLGRSAPPSNTNTTSTAQRTKNTRTTRSFMATANSPPTSSNTPTSNGTNTRYYVGKDPSNFSRPPSSKTSTQASPRETSARDNNNIRRPPRSKSAVRLSKQGSSRSASQNSQATTQSPVVNKDQPVWPVWCVWCQASPAIPECYTTELRQLFPPPSDVPRIFATIGILHDQHLRFLASRPRAERHAFILSFIGSGQYDQLKALQISKTLDEYAAEHAGEKLASENMEGCSIHLERHEVAVPSDLANVLIELGMEEVGPAAVFLGFDTNTKFQEARGYDEATKKEFLLDNIKVIKPSPLQKLMLELALKPKW
ncbi:hypothetical protein K438DRAFT_1805738 [Mycena galopus ATCC 62051]|nr:hypothetical protein K438DRAFT_1805738 [Mycena galopus ATCC 62051]